MHQPLLLPNKPLEVVVLVWAGVSSQQRTEGHLVNGKLTNQHYLNNIINPLTVPLHLQHSSYLIFMDDNTPSYRGRIIKEWLLEARLSKNGMASNFSRTASHRNLLDQLSCHLEGYNPAPRNLNDLRAALQEELNAMPQRTISRLVIRM